MLNYNSIKNRIIILFTCVVVIACEDEWIGQTVPGSTEIIQINERATNPEELLAARQYYSNQIVLESQTRSLDNDSIVNYTPYLKGEPSWKFYAFGQNDSITVVDVDVTDRIRQDYLTEEHIAAYMKYKQWKFRQSYTRYVYTRAIRIGKENGFYMTIIPSVSYIRNAYKRIRYNTYLRRDASLDGYVLFHSLDGKLVNGWEYKKGELTGKILPANKTRNRNRTLSLIASASDYSVELQMKTPVTVRSHESDDGWDVDGGSFPEVVITPEGGTTPPPPISPDHHPEITNPNEGDDGEYGASGGGGGNGITPTNFTSKIVTPTFCDKVMQKLGVNPLGVRFVVASEDLSGTNATYKNGQITVYNKFFHSGYTPSDMESIIFHELVHYKQQVVDRLPISKETKIPYNVYYTEYDIQEYKDIFYDDMKYTNIPFQEKNRTDLQQKTWVEKWNQMVQPYLDDYENKRTHVVYENKVRIQSEIEAYQSQLNQYQHVMSDSYKNQTELNLATMENRFNKIKDL